MSINMDADNREYFARERKWKTKAIEKFGPKPLEPIKFACPDCKVETESPCIRSKFARKNFCPGRRNRRQQAECKWIKDVYSEIDRLELQWRIGTN